MFDIDDVFSSVFEMLVKARDTQRNFYYSGFEKDNKAEIVASVENNCKRLDKWTEMLQNLKREMTESGLFVFDKRRTNQRRSACYDSDAIKQRSDSASAKPRSIEFLGRRKDIRHWKEIPLFVCEMLYEKHPDIFRNIEGVSELRGKKRLYITTYKEKLTSPTKIKGSPYYFESNQDSNHCMKFAYSIAEHFGYQKTDISIDE